MSARTALVGSECGIRAVMNGVVVFSSSLSLLSSLLEECDEGEGENRRA